MPTVPGNVDSTNVAAVIKRLYPQIRLDQMWKLRYPLLAEISKADTFEGSSITHPVEYDPPSASRTFSDAQGDRFPTGSVAFQVTRVRDYSTARIDAETMYSTRSNMGGFVRVLDREIENMLLMLQKRTATALYRNLGGAIGRAASEVGSTITLVDRTDAINFHVGQKVRSSATDGTSGSLKAGELTVAGVDFATGNLTFDEDVGTTFTSFAANDFLFTTGDFGLSLSGLAGWIPTTAPGGSDSFFGVNRSVDVMRLSGHRVTDTSLSIEEAIQELAANITFGGGSPNRCYMNPFKVKELAMELNSKVVRDPGGRGVSGFSGIMVDTAAGSLEVLGDPACPLTLGYVLDLSSWELTHLEGLPHIVMDDGLRAARVTDADQLEVRGRLFGNARCFAPGKNGVFQMA